MKKQYLTFILIACNLTVFASNENSTLNEYLYNKISVNKIKTFTEKNSVDSALIYAHKVFESNDKTFHIKVNVMLSDMYFNFQNYAIKPFDWSFEGMQKRNTALQKNKDLILHYLDEAVKHGLCWNCIDENKKEYYDSNRYQINRKFYLANYANLGLMDLIKEIEVTDQGNRRGIVDQQKMEFDDSLNCDKLTNWIDTYGWPTFLSISVENSICWSNEHSSLMTFLRHYPREKLLFFYDSAYQSAEKGFSSWNLAFEVKLSFYNRFAEQFIRISEEKTAFISPLLQTYIDSIDGTLDLNKSMFEILSVAEISQNYQIAVFPNNQFYKTNPQNAYRQLMKLYKTLEQLGSTAKPTDFMNITTFNPLTYKYYFPNSDNSSSFFLVLISDKNKQVSWTVPVGYPTIIENSNLSKNDIDSIFKNR
ncbi:MAG: hypothetical protein RBR97_18070 [Bacteroidales bacterium]|nr:hypothetical protein [Bacteroidales bacterium]